jgi:hypothetical protein
LTLPYIETNASRHGRIRYYFRFERKRLARLPDDPDSEEFAKVYWEVRNRHEAGEPLASQEPLPPSLT